MNVDRRRYMLYQLIGASVNESFPKIDIIWYIQFSQPSQEFPS